MPPGLSGFGSHFLGDFPSYSQSSLGWVIREAAWPLAIAKSHVQISDVNFLYILLAIHYNHSGNLFTLPIVFVHSELLISNAYRELCILPFQFLYCQNFKVPTLHHSICICCQGHWSGGSWGAVSGPAPSSWRPCGKNHTAAMVPSEQAWYHHNSQQKSELAPLGGPAFVTNQYPKCLLQYLIIVLPRCFYDWI